MGQSIPKRTVILVVLAVLMSGLVLLDQLGYLGGAGQPETRPAPVAVDASPAVAPLPAEVNPAPASATALAVDAVNPAGATAVPVTVAAMPAPVPATDSSWEDRARRYAVLKGLAAQQTQLEHAYQKLAAPYAEATATYRGLYGAGAQPGAADRYLREIIPGHIRVSQLQVSPPVLQPGGGIYSASATLTLLSTDSSAMQQAILDLGNPDNGTLWHNLTLSVDSGRKQLRLEGQLSLLWVEAAE